MAREPRTVTGVHPSTGQGNTSVWVTGTGFTGVTSVTFGGFACGYVKVVSATRISCYTPAPPDPNGGAVDVTVNTRRGSATLQGGYFYMML